MEIFLIGGWNGRKEIICTLILSHLLLKLGRGDSEKILAC
jgi:hypothetical protein